MSLRFDWFVKPNYNLLPLSQTRQTFEVFCDRFAGHSEAIPMQIAVLKKELHHRGCAADRVQVLHDVLPRRLHVANKRCGIRKALKILEGDVHAG